MIVAAVRTDSWAAALTEEQSWSLYYKARSCRWNEAAAWAVEEFGLDRPPSRTAFYAWLDQMRRDESAHRLEQQRIACLEAAAIAKESPLADEVTVRAYKQMAVETALRTGSAKEGLDFIAMAMAITDRTLKKQELKLKEAAQETKEDALKLMREKFEAAERRLASVEQTVNDTALTDEERVAKMKSIFGLK